MAAEVRKSILVIGGTGYLGSKVVDALLKQNVKVSALAREGSDAKNLEAKGVEIIRGDLTQPATLLPALKNKDVVISTAIGYSNRRKGDSLQSVDDIGNHNLVDALKQAKIRRFVFLSILTAEKARSVPHFWQKKLIEDYMDQAGLAYVSLRPGAFLDQMPAWDPYVKGIKSGNLKVLGTTTVKWSMILTEDLAKYLSKAALDETIPSGKIDIGMEEPVNAEMIARFASEYTGREIKVSAAPWMIMGTMFSLIGLFKPQMADMKKMFDYFFSGQYVADTRLQKKYFGEVPVVKDSMYRYFRQIDLKKA